jgi:hypothetical protein
MTWGWLSMVYKRYICICPRLPYLDIITQQDAKNKNCIFHIFHRLLSDQRNAKFLLLTACILQAILANFLTLKMETASSSWASLNFYRARWLHFPSELLLPSHCKCSRIVATAAHLQHSAVESPSRFKESCTFDYTELIKLICQFVYLLMSDLAVVMWWYFLKEGHA